MQLALRHAVRPDRIAQVLPDFVGKARDRSPEFSAAGKTGGRADGCRKPDPAGLFALQDLSVEPGCLEYTEWSAEHLRYAEDHGDVHHFTIGFGFQKCVADSFR